MGLLELGGTVRAAGGFEWNRSETMGAFLGGWRCCRSRLLGRVDCPNHQKDDKGNNNKIDNILEEQTIFNFRAADREGQTLEIDATDE